jgi:23S rRNA (pseudouridine1915-N3)-methyltransferase
VRLSLIAFGKLKTPGLRQAADYYQKLIRPWSNLEEIELKPLAVPEKSPALRTQIQEKEGLILLEKIKKEPGRSFVILLDEKGKTRSTLQWAQDIQNWESDGVSTLIFCIGSSLGFSNQVRAIAKGSMSLGPQTLSHELARVVLCEQLYRAYSVLRGHPYHNEGS